MKNFNLVYKIKKEKTVKSGGSSVNDICFNKIKFFKLLPSCKSVNPLQTSDLKLKKINSVILIFCLSVEGDAYAPHAPVLATRLQ